jgi:hypothetical protein
MKLDRVTLVVCSWLLVDNAYRLVRSRNAPPALIDMVVGF